MPLHSRIFKLAYRLTMPGGIVMVAAVLVLRSHALGKSESPIVHAIPLLVFVGGMALSAFFRRGRIFFALLILCLSQTALDGIAPLLSVSAGQALANLVAVLLPLNLLTLAFVKERGIISSPGRRRLMAVAFEVAVVSALCTPRLVGDGAWLQSTLLPEKFAAWSHISQLALSSFFVAAVMMAVPIARRYTSVESGLLWSLLASFIALRAGSNSIASAVFFATSGAVLLVALLETSYNMAYHDELTQLPSRRALNEALLKLPETYTIAMVDVDHFKKFNDNYGHEAGDQVLRLVASRLARIAGGGRAYRYGGEEFTVVFSGKATEEVFIYLDRMRGIIEQSTFTVRGKDRRKTRSGKLRTVYAKRQTNVTVSIGVASSSDAAMTPAEAIRIADQALYRAKARGRNCTVVAKNGKGAGSVRQSMHVLSAGSL